MPQETKLQNRTHANENKQHSTRNDPSTHRVRCSTAHIAFAVTPVEAGETTSNKW